MTSGHYIPSMETFAEPTLTPAPQRTTGQQSIRHVWTLHEGLPVPFTTYLKSESTDPSTVYMGSTPAENLEKMLKTSLWRSSSEQVHVEWLEQYVPWRIKEIPALSLFTVPNHKQCKFFKKKKKRMRENEREKREGRCGEQGSKQKGERGMYNLILSSHGHPILSCPLWMCFYRLMMVLVLFTKANITISTTHTWSEGFVQISSPKYQIQLALFMLRTWIIPQIYQNLWFSLGRW